MNRQMRLILIVFALFTCVSCFSQSLTTSYTYDALNRLTDVTYPNGQQVHYEYDVLGNRISRTVIQIGYMVQTAVLPEGAGAVTGAGTYTQGTECTLTATANEGYTFVNWTENGTEVSTEAIYSFTVSSGRNLVANFVSAIPISTQTIELAAGTNWVSFNVDVTLDELKAALVATGCTEITIQGQKGNTRYNNGRWRGNLTYDVNMMFVISVNAVCEITLEGMPLDPAEHPITLAIGNNWIGYPLNVSMTPADAFAGFAENGDVISSQGSNARYTNGRWRGTCDLVPGKGFIYQSTSDKTLVFPSSKIVVK